MRGDSRGGTWLSGERLWWAPYLASRALEAQTVGVFGLHKSSEDVSSSCVAAVKLFGSIYTLWTAPFEENHGSRQAVWQPASCVAAKYIVDSPSWGEPQMSSSCVAAVKLCGSKYILWNAPLEENYGWSQAVWQPASCVAAEIYWGPFLLRRTTNDVKLSGSWLVV